ncbi:MAG TPA: (deoxy)nucleoside triphosphate pyrophosphohydrolase [Prosthecobacter sp.]|nr:(deoxy)nucleoside triphosphate pyrophosphohydrolase [Prosthecobacter sp.]
MSPSPLPTPVVCAVIQRDGLILLAQRPVGKRLAGLWEFPGGKVEPDEQPEDALHRELAEELGCRVRIIRAGPPVGHEYDWGAIRLYPFLCQMGPDSCEPIPHEHTALAWVAADQLLNHALAPADLPVVQWLANFC